MEGIQVSTEVAGSRNHISIIKVGGYIDTTTSSELERALDALLKQGRFFLIVDLGNVDYISSAGWGIFISEIKSIRENGGDLKLVRMVPDVYEIFELLEFHHILDVYDSVDEAVNKFEVFDTSGQPTPQQAPRPADSQKPAEGSKPEQESTARQPAAQSEVPGKKPEETKEVAVADMMLDEKIQRIVQENPEFGAFKIKRELNTDSYGYTKVSWFSIRSELSNLGLNNKSKRIAFALKSS